jgi:membrane protein
MLLPGRDVPIEEFGRALWRKVRRDDLLDYAGSCAFSAILAVFPFLLFAVALAGLVVAPDTLAALVQEVRRAVPAEVADLVIGRLDALTSGRSPGLATFGALLSVWSASGGVAALITAFDRAYEVHEGRPFWKTRGLALLVTVAGAVFFVAAAALALAAPAVAAHLAPPLRTALIWLRWPAAALLMTLILAILYDVLPDVEHERRLVTLGSLTATAVWILVSLGFSFYAARFARYEVVYGALGGVIVVLVWLWLSALAVLLGAEINAALDGLTATGTRSACRPPACSRPSGSRTRRRRRSST